MAGLLLEPAEEEEPVLASPALDASVVVDDDGLLAVSVEDVLLVGDVLLDEPEVLPLVEAVRCADSLWLVWSAVEEAVADEGDVEALGSELAVVLDCAAVEGDDATLGLLAPAVDAVRELSAPS